MNRLSLMVFATFVLTAPGAQAINCDELEGVLRKHAQEMRNLSEEFGAADGNYPALCRLGREKGLPYLKASLNRLERYAGCSLANTAKKAIVLQQMIIAGVEESVASDCKAAGI